MGNIVIDFEAIVEIFGDSPALSCKNDTCDYRHLNQYVNQLAQYLREQGIKPGDRIAAACPRGLTQFITILGILKARAAYVPIDLRYPTSRIEFILNDCQPQLIIAHEPLTKVTTSIPYFFYNLPNALTNYSSQNLNLNYSDDDIAYVIYTSGSTGNPKGVTVQHGGVCNIAHFIAEECQIKPKVKFLQFASICFDLSVGEWTPTLLAGGELVLVTEDEMPPHKNISDILLQKKINILFTTPTMISTFSSHSLPDLKILITIGEACSQTLVDEWGEHLLFVNAYGPTEASVLATWGRCYPHQPVHLGQALSNMTVLLVDEKNQLITAHHQPGEIIIFGDGVAAGYYNKPELTHQKFNQIFPFKTPHEKNYRTGDFACYDDQGRLIYLGRKDNQVKVRGFRIELGEIAKQLEKHSSIQQAVVKLYGASEYNKQIVIYYIFKKDHIASPEELGNFLKESLPAYMLPSFYHPMDIFPQTNSGKVDMRALSDPVLVEHIAETLDSELAQKMASIWSKILHMPITNKYTDFFTAGGNSISLVQLFMEIEKTFKCKPDLNTFLQEPTISALEQIIDHAHTDLVIDNLSLAKQDRQFSITIPIENILLTGASGFLGCFLLRELLKKTNARIYCLVRAKNSEEAEKKLLKSLRYFHLQDDINFNRIQIVNGDLSLPHFNLSHSEWQTLSEKIDLILHNGAQVHHLLGYSQLRAANVASTQELIQLATQQRLKAIHFISTVSAIDQVDSNGVALENFPSENPATLAQFNGYALSKWTSEHLIRSAMQHGLNGTIMRPGNITGDSQHGISQPEHNHALLLVKGCMQMQAAPDWNYTLEMTPVDIVAKAIVQLILAPAANHSVFNLNNPQTIVWTDYIRILNEQGANMRILPYSEWCQLLEAQDEQNAIFPLRFFYLQGDGHYAQQCHCEKAQSILRKSHIDYPQNYSELISLYTRYLLESGFFSTELIKPPSRRLL